MQACVVALIRPIRAVTRADHLPLWRAWGVHVAGGVMVVGVLMVLAAWSDVQGTATPVQVAGALSNLLPELVVDFQSVMAWAELIVAVLLVEIACGLAALGTMSWCAQDEKLRSSYGRALRRLFLLTPHASTVVALTGGAITWIDRISWDYSEMFSTGDILFMLLLIAGYLWSLWAMLAAMGCRPAPAMCCWPARCEGCGYQLTGIELDHDCPECGLAIVKTLGEYVRPGIVEPRKIVSWLCHTYHSLRRPTVFGKKLHAMSSDTSHRRSLTATIVLLMLTSPIAIGVVCVVMNITRSITQQYGYISWGELVRVSIIVGMWIGLIMTTTTVGIALGGASLVGGIEGWRHGRNLMPVAIRAACHQSGFAVVWACVFWCNIAACTVAMELNLLRSITGNPDALIGIWFLGMIGLGFVIYLTLIYRTTHAARYANW